MSLYVLDTDILTLYRQGDATVCQNVAAHPPSELAITVMSVDECMSGWFRLLRQATRSDQLIYAYEQLADSVQFLAGWRILPLTAPSVARYDQLKALKLNVRKMDLRIAAITLENTGTLVTRNLRDFQRVPGLLIENWAV
jgi:tRNA(fMet)-specific endonuclease VapC